MAANQPNPTIPERTIQDDYNICIQYYVIRCLGAYCIAIILFVLALVGPKYC